VRIEARLFLGIAALLFSTSVVYGFWTSAEAEDGGVEVVGVTGLVLSGGLALIVGSYFAFVARRIDPRPEDRGDADIAEGAGELGFFSPGSYWPLGLAASAALAGIALALYEAWLIALALIAVIFTVGGLLFEYYTKGQSSPTA
jgi:hypothetical protein